MMLGSVELNFKDPLWKMYVLIGDVHPYVFNEIVNASVCVCIIIVYMFLLPYSSLFPYISETFFKNFLQLCKGRL